MLSIFFPLKLGCHCEGALATVAISKNGGRDCFASLAMTDKKGAKGTGQTYGLSREWFEGGRVGKDNIRGGAVWRF